MADEFDYVVVGGGSAGAVVAARLSEDPSVSVCVLEWGPTDVGNDDVLQIRRWLGLLEGPLDLAYRTTLQPRGNAHIVHSRAKVLGGCSSHNTMIWFKPFPGDWQDWVDAGASGWGPERDGALLRAHPGAALDRGREGSQPDPVRLDRGLRRRARRRSQHRLERGAVPRRGRLPRRRLRRRDRRALLVERDVPAPDPRSPEPVRCRPSRAPCASSCRASAPSPCTCSARAAASTAWRRGARSSSPAGSVDTPRLLLLSGIGPRDQLEHLGIDVAHDLPGVGENLIDHPESIIIWKLKRPMGPEGAMDADCALFVNRLGGDDRPDLMYHTYQLPFTYNTERLGYEVPDDRWCICMTPNIPRSHSKGRLFLLSRDPEIRPALDFRYFTDDDGYDEQTIVDGLKIAREVAATGPFADWIEREIAPGPDDHERQRPERVRPRRAPHRLPPLRHLPHGRGRRRSRRRRPRAARARPGGPLDRRRLDLPLDADRQPGRRHVHGRREGRRPRPRPLTA